MKSGQNKQIVRHRVFFGYYSAESVIFGKFFNG